MNTFVIFLFGFFCGGVVIFLLMLLRQRDTESLLQKMVTKNESDKERERLEMIERLKESFGSLSLAALSKNSDEFLKLAHESLSKQTESGEKNLEEKKKLIDHTVSEMKKDLKNMQNLVVDFEKDRGKKFGELSETLKITAQETKRLQETTTQLKTALVNTKQRGQWGEKIADDILRSIGFIEGINYLKQKEIKSSHTRPDFTFLLPQDLKVNMDVKFPLDNYLLFLNEEKESAKIKKQFLKDVRDKVKEVTSRDYINPEEKTLDYVIMFIPNEQVYGFIHEHDNTLLTDALRQKVILCSPFTLYAVLSVIRQAVDSFNLDQTASQILEKLSVFYKQWQKFIDSFEKIGKKLAETQNEFDYLTSTRKNSLERSLKNIEELRQQTKMVTKS
ncbi:DNA recombination protein RmuC [Candidatus Auribacterota bacterium]